MGVSYEHKHIHREQVLAVSSRKFCFVSSITESRLQVGQFILYFDEK